jgi:aryl-alcohol dehydrogenase-like predicted oxidoreductase
MADGSLCRLKREVIDLYQLHNPGAEVCRRDATWKALEGLVRHGKIRFYGASISSEEELDLCLARACAAVQFEFSALRPQRRPWIARCAAAGVAVIVRTPLAYGALSGKYTVNYLLPQADFRHEARWGGKAFRKFVRQAQELRFLARPGQTMAQAALRFVLAEPGVSVVIPGGKTPEQVRDNCAAGDAALSPDDLARLTEIQHRWLAEEK